jgi:hypothetical protein
MGDLADLKPQSCRVVGLECDTCTSAAARSTAKLCLNLTATLIETTFFKMYPDPACADQLAHFAQAYFEATAPFETAGRLATAAA